MWKTLWITLTVSLFITSCNNSSSPELLKALEFINKNLLSKVGLEINLKDKMPISTSEQPLPTPSLEHRTVNAEFFQSSLLHIFRSDIPCKISSGITMEYVVDILEYLFKHKIHNNIAVFYA
jgi:hypothetical protein